MDFCPYSKVMSLLFNNLSRFVIFFSAKKQTSFNFMAAVTVCSDFEAQENKVCHCFHCFPHSICHKMMGLDAMILVFWMLSFKSAFSLSSFTLIKCLLSFSSLSSIRMVSHPYLRLLLFLLKSWCQLVIHPTWHFAWCTLFSSSPELRMIPVWHFAWCIPTDLFIHTISISPCPFSNTYTCRLNTRTT